MIKSTGYTTARGGSDLGIGISGICNGVLMLTEGIGDVGYFDVDLLSLFADAEMTKFISWISADTHLVPILTRTYLGLSLRFFLSAAAVDC